VVAFPPLVRPAAGRVASQLAPSRPQIAGRPRGENCEGQSASEAELDWQEEGGGKKRFFAQRSLSRSAWCHQFGSSPPIFTRTSSSPTLCSAPMISPFGASSPSESGYIEHWLASHAATGSTPRDRVALVNKIIMQSVIFLLHSLLVGRKHADVQSLCATSGCISG